MIDFSCDVSTCLFLGRYPAPFGSQRRVTSGDLGHFCARMILARIGRGALLAQLPVPWR